MQFTTAATIRTNRAGSTGSTSFLSRPATLWTIQGVLAALFLFAGVMKLVSPADSLDEQSSLPVLFLRFIAFCEALGALRLVFPQLLKIRPGLTTLAAAGLLIIMVGATVISAVTVGVLPALIPLTVGLLCAAIVYGRGGLATRSVEPSTVAAPAL